MWFKNSRYRQGKAKKMNMGSLGVRERPGLGAESVSIFGNLSGKEPAMEQKWSITGNLMDNVDANENDNLLYCLIVANCTSSDSLLEYME